MRRTTIENVKIFANEFATTIMKGNVEGTNEYYWNISYEYDYDEDEDNIISSVYLELDFDDDAIIVTYGIRRDNRCRYSYNVKFEINDVTICDNDTKEFREIVDVINMCQDGLFDKICAYLHKEAMDSIYNDIDGECGKPPIYEPYYTPSIIDNFMKMYKISKYVPIDVELVDEKGLPIKYLSIKSVNFNDEGNRLLIMMSEE